MSDKALLYNPRMVAKWQYNSDEELEEDGPFYKMSVEMPDGVRFSKGEVDAIYNDFWKRVHRISPIEAFWRKTEVSYYRSFLDPNKNDLVPDASKTPKGLMEFKRRRMAYYNWCAEHMYEDLFMGRESLDRLLRGMHKMPSGLYYPNEFDYQWFRAKYVFLMLHRKKVLKRVFVHFPCFDSMWGNQERFEKSWDSPLLDPVLFQRMVKLKRLPYGLEDKKELVYFICLSFGPWMVQKLDDIIDANKLENDFIRFHLDNRGK